MKRVTDFLIVSRYEYMVGGVFFLFTVSALATGSWALFGASLALIAWGTVVWYLSHMVGSQINPVIAEKLMGERRVIGGFESSCTCGMPDLY